MWGAWGGTIIALIPLAFPLRGVSGTGKKKVLTPFLDEGSMLFEVGYVRPVSLQGVKVCTRANFISFKTTDWKF